MDIHYFQLLFSILIIHHATPYEITPANERELLALNEVQDVYTFCRHHTLQYEIDFQGIAEIKNRLNGAMTMLNELCNNVQLNYICSHMVKEINALCDKLQQQNDVIRISKIQPSDQVVGSVLSALEKTIILADTTYYNLKESIEKMQSIVNFFAKYQNRIQDQLEYNIKFDQLAQLTIMNLKKCINLFQSMIEIFVHKNFKHITDVIPTDIIKKDISRIVKKAGNESCLIPIQTKGTYVHEILKASGIRSFETAFSYAIEVKIPTINQNNFKLIQAIPIPFTYKNETFELHSVHDYFLLRQNEKTKQTFAIPFSAEERSECNIIIDRIVCTPKHAVQVTNEKIWERFFIPHYTLCTFMTLENMIMKPIECRLHRITAKNQIIRINQESYFIYILYPDSIRIGCNLQQTEQSLNHSVKITDLSPMCTLEIKGSYLPEHTIAPINKVRKFAFPLLVPTLNTIEVTQNKKKTLEFQPIQDLRPEFETFQKEISQITEAPPQTTTTDNHFFNNTTILLIIFYAVIVISLCGIKLYFRYENRFQRSWTLTNPATSATTFEL